MHLIKLRTVKEFAQAHPRAREPLAIWYDRMRALDPTAPAMVKRAFGASVDILPDDRAVFDIAGNHFRLVVKFHYKQRRVYVRFIGTHAEYDRIDAETV